MTAINNILYNNSQIPEAYAFAFVKGANDRDCSLLPSLSAKLEIRTSTNLGMSLMSAVNFGGMVSFVVRAQLITGGEASLR